MARHTGGVRGIELARGQCPVCGRSISGGRWGTGAGKLTGKVRLRKHKPPIRPGSDKPAKTMQRCRGGGMSVPPLPPEITNI